MIYRAIFSDYDSYYDYICSSEELAKKAVCALFFQYERISSRLEYDESITIGQVKIYELIYDAIINNDFELAYNLIIKYSTDTNYYSGSYSIEEAIVDSKIEFDIDKSLFNTYYKKQTFK